MGRHQPYASRVQLAPVFLPSNSGEKWKVPGKELTHCLCSGTAASSSLERTFWHPGWANLWPNRQQESSQCFTFQDLMTNLLRFLRPSHLIFFPFSPSSHAYWNFLVKITEYLLIKSWDNIGIHSFGIKEQCYILRYSLLNNLNGKRKSCILLMGSEESNDF